MRQNKCNHLLFYVLNFIQFCVRKLLLPIVVLKMIFIYDVFSTKLYAHEMFGLRGLELFFRVVPKSICGPLAYTTDEICVKKKRFNLYRLRNGKKTLASPTKSTF